MTAKTRKRTTMTITEANRIARQATNGRCTIEVSDVDPSLWEFTLDERYVETHEPMTRERLVAFLAEWTK